MPIKADLFKDSVKYYGAALSAAAVWGFFAIPLRNLKSYPADQILHFRIFFSLIFTWVIILAFRQRQLRTDVLRLKNAPIKQKKNILFLTAIAGVLITGNWYAFIYATNSISIKSAAFAYMVCPLITALGGFLLLNEKASTYKIGGIAIAVLSIILLATGSLYEVAWSVFIASLYAFYLVIQRMVPDIDKLNMLGVQLIISALIMLPLFFYHNYGLPDDTAFWLNIILIALVFTVLPLFLSLYALIGIDSSTMGILIYINPIVAFTVAFIYFDEYVTPLQGFAYCLLFLAVIVFNWDLLKRLVKNRSTN